MVLIIKVHLSRWHSSACGEKNFIFVLFLPKKYVYFEIWKNKFFTDKISSFLFSFVKHPILRKNFSKEMALEYDSCGFLFFMHVSRASSKIFQVQISCSNQCLLLSLSIKLHNSSRSSFFIEDWLGFFFAYITSWFFVEQLKKLLGNR